MKTNKKCTGPCGKMLALDRFGTDRSKKSGKNLRCKKCCALKARERVKEKGSWKPHTPEQKERRREHQGKWQKTSKAKAIHKRHRDKVRKDPLKSWKKRANRKRWRESKEGAESIVRSAVRRRARKLEQLCLCCDPNEREQTFAAGWIEEDCYICGAPADVMDHVIPLAAGKPGDALHCLDNFRSICKPCNGSGGKWYTLWPAHLGWDASPGWEKFLAARR